MFTQPQKVLVRKWLVFLSSQQFFFLVPFFLHLFSFNQTTLTENCTGLSRFLSFAIFIFHLLSRPYQVCATKHAMHFLFFGVKRKQSENKVVARNEHNKTITTTLTEATTAAAVKYKKTNFTLALFSIYMRETR